MITKEKIEELIDKSNHVKYSYHELREGAADFDVDGYIFSYVLSKRGYRGHDHSTYTFIFKISKSGEEDTFWRETGYYGSYSGTDWNYDFEQVKKITKTIEVYE
jgi:hypothetical protein